jgi:hypothetical protein
LARRSRGLGDVYKRQGRRTGPGQYSSFFSALTQAGITAKQGRGGLVKGPNFDKFYKKIFE